MIKGVILDYNRTIYDPDSSSLIKGAVELLDYCKNHGIKLSLMSRGESTRAQEIKDLGIEQYFTKIVIISKEKKEEKGVDHFQSCALAMGLEMREVAVIGDRVKAEIMYANSLGMTTFWYAKGKYADDIPETDEEKPDYQIRDLAEVIRVLEAQEQ